MSAGNAVSKAAVEDFLIREARLLDEGKFEDWLALFADDGTYWVPSEPGQTDPKNVASIMYEDTAVLEMRVQRLAHPRAYALDPTPRTTHLVSNVTVEEPAGDRIVTRAAFVMTEYRGGPLTTYSGQLTHHLRPAGDSFEIVLKRVDLVNCDGVHGIMTVPF